MQQENGQYKYGQAALVTLESFKGDKKGTNVELQSFMGRHWESCRQPLSL